MKATALFVRLLVALLLVCCSSTASAAAGTAGLRAPSVTVALTRESSMNHKLRSELIRQSRGTDAGGSGRVQVQCIDIPCIEHVPVAGASADVLAKALLLADLVLLTSPKAATLAIQALNEHAADGGRATAQFASVGSGTSAVLLKHGVRPVFEAPEATALSLARNLPLKFRTARVLHPVSALADGALETALRRRGFSQVARLDAYSTGTPRWSDTTKALASNEAMLDAVTFGSPSAVRGWLLNGGSRAVPAFVIGETTAAAARKGGFRAVHSAPAAATSAGGEAAVVRRWANAVLRWAAARDRDTEHGP